MLADKRRVGAIKAASSPVQATRTSPRKHTPSARKVAALEAASMLENTNRSSTANKTLELKSAAKSPKQATTAAAKIAKALKGTASLAKRAIRTTGQSRAHKSGPAIKDKEASPPKIAWAPTIVSPFGKATKCRSEKLWAANPSELASATTSGRHASPAKCTVKGKKLRGAEKAVDKSRLRGSTTSPVAKTKATKDASPPKSLAQPKTQEPFVSRSRGGKKSPDGAPGAKRFSRSKSPLKKRAASTSPVHGNANARGRQTRRLPVNAGTPNPSGEVHASDEGRQSRDHSVGGIRRTTEDQNDDKVVQSPTRRESASPAKRKTKSPAKAVAKPPIMPGGAAKESQASLGKRSRDSSTASPGRKIRKRSRSSTKGEAVRSPRGGSAQESDLMSGRETSRSRAGKIPPCDSPAEHVQIHTQLRTRTRSPVKHPLSDVPDLPHSKKPKNTSTTPRHKEDETPQKRSAKRSAGRAPAQRTSEGADDASVSTKDARTSKSPSRRESTARNRPPSSPAKSTRRPTIARTQHDPSTRPPASAQPSAPGHGPLTSPTNPPYIAGTKQPNPFFETLPLPKVWHSHIPSKSSFSDSLFPTDCESCITDVGEVKREPQPVEGKGSHSLFGSLVKFLAMGLDGIYPGAEEVEEAGDAISPLKLPEVREEDVVVAVRELEGVLLRAG